MTRSEAIEAVDPCAKEMEMKEELQRLVRGICGEGESRIEAFDLASKTLSALKDLKLKRSTSSQRRDSVVPVPEHFLCPISSELMKDPVVLATGQVRLGDSVSVSSLLILFRIDVRVSVG